MPQFCIALRFSVAAFVAVGPLGAHALEPKLPLTKTGAFSISSDEGDFAYTPLPLVPRALNVKVELDASTRQILTGPSSARNLADDATITSSFARYDHPTISTSHTSTLLSNFSLTGVCMLDGVDFSIARFDNYNADDGAGRATSLGRIFGRQG